MKRRNSVSSNRALPTIRGIYHNRSSQSAPRSVKFHCDLDTASRAVPVIVLRSECGLRSRLVTGLGLLFSTLLFHRYIISTRLLYTHKYQVASTCRTKANFDIILDIKFRSVAIGRGLVHACSFRTSRLL